MRLSISLLKKFVSIPDSDILSQRSLFDNLGLEVKSVEEQTNNRILNIETLANRGDHLSALGIAREVAANLLVPIRYPQISSQLPKKPCSTGVEIRTKKCSRYALMEMSIKEELKVTPELSSTIESANNNPGIVNYLNYLLLEIGQPMHAFDRDKLDGDIIIDETLQKESIQGLNGQSYTVPPGSIVICDQSKIIAVAGVIGCSNSMVDVGTKRFCIESASFDSVAIRKTARTMNISTDASYLFERGCDQEMVLFALQRLKFLIESVCSSAQFEGLTSKSTSEIEKRIIALKPEVIRIHANNPKEEIPDEEIIQRLSLLGYKAEPSKGQLNLEVPSWRIWDVHNEDDVVEDFFRVYGMNRVCRSLPVFKAELPLVNSSGLEQVKQKVEGVLSGNGFYEVITSTFYSSRELKVISGLDKGMEAKHVSIANALDTKNGYLRLTNIFNFCHLASHNHRRGVDSVKVYEFCRLFSVPNKDQTPLRSYQFEEDVLCLAVSGEWYEHQWMSSTADLDDLLKLFKGLLEAIICISGNDLFVEASNNIFLHPQCQGALCINEKVVGVFGLVHPNIKKEFSIESDLLYAEINWELLLKAVTRNKFQEPNKFPNIYRDATIDVPHGSMSTEVLKRIKSFGLANLESIKVIDSFQKPSESIRHVTFRLIFQSAERTLESSEVDNEMKVFWSKIKEVVVA